MPDRYGSGEKPSQLRWRHVRVFGRNEEAYKTYSALGVATKRANDWAELNIDTLGTMLRAHLVSSEVPLATVPCCGDGAACGKRRDVVGKADTQGRILVADTGEAQARHSASVADAAVTLPSRACGEVDLLEEGELADESLRLLVCCVPVSETLNPAVWC